VLGQEIKRARGAARLTQEQLAHAAGLSREYLNRLEGGRVSPTYDVLLAVAKALKIKLSVLIERAESGPTDEVAPMSTQSTGGKRSTAAEFPTPHARVIGAVLEEWRQAARVTRRSLAARLKVRTEDVQAIEAGLNVPDVRQLIVWCQVCRMPLGDALPHLARSAGIGT
jgi:transcriptional regulator with XRE-family HTH domain